MIITSKEMIFVFGFTLTNEEKAFMLEVTYISPIFLDNLPKGIYGPIVSDSCS